MCNVYSVFWKFQNEQKWQHANKACCCSSKREKAKPSAADNNIVECVAVVSKDSSAI